MSSELTNAEKLRRLPWSIFSEATNAVFYYLTFFGSVFVLFLSELGLSKTQIGNLLSLLPFAGLIALFIAPAVARHGYKRTYLIFFGGRKLIAVFLLFTPWVLATFGSQVVIWYIVGIVAAFAVSRAVAITAVFPWIQEYVPSSVRGKYSAINQIFWSLASFLAVTLGGIVLGSAPNLQDFNVLFAVGVFFGLIALVAATFIPGGAPVESSRSARASHLDLTVAARDKNFVLLAVGVGLTLLAIGPLVSFLPLFLRDDVGLPSGAVVWLQAGTMIGGMASSYVWGWAADRYGSKPIMASGAYLLALQALLWWLLPRQSGLSLYIALVIAFFQGIATLGWQIGLGRLLYVGVVPRDKNNSYLALYYAWISIVEGFGQLLGGRVLDRFAGVSGYFWIFPIDSYSFLFLAAILLPLLNALLLRGVRAEGEIGVARFAGFFLRGNPLRAMQSLIGYQLVRSERATVSVTERLGQSRSPLAVDELLEALDDPRFYVRFEAIVSIARGGSDPRLTSALVKVLHRGGPALSVITAWALGRMGDREALPVLREGLGSEYRSVQAHCARSLGSLGDTEAVPLLLDRLQSETNEDLSVAFGAALGALGVQEAAPDLLAMLYKSPSEDGRLELALALARLIGNEHHFIHLWRGMRIDPGTASSQAVASVRRKAGRTVSDPSLVAAMEECAEALARRELESGAVLLRRIIIASLPMDSVGEIPSEILRDCAQRLDEFGAERQEYMLLALHTMQESW